MPKRVTYITFRGQIVPPNYTRRGFAELMARLQAMSAMELYAACVRHMSYVDSLSSDIRRQLHQIGEINVLANRRLRPDELAELEQLHLPSAKTRRLEAQANKLAKRLGIAIPVVDNRPAEGPEALGL